MVHFVYDRNRFILQITSLAEFAELVAIIRGETPDEEKLRELAEKLGKHTTKLDNAVRRDERIRREPR